MYLSLMSVGKPLGGGGWGVGVRFGPDHQIIDHNSKTTLSLGRILAKLTTQGVAAAVLRPFEKLNI